VKLFDNSSPQKYLHKREKHSNLLAEEKVVLISQGRFPFGKPVDPILLCLAQPKGISCMWNIFGFYRNEQFSVGV
jgi:hypothetical protein